jgi:hypothetical protein
MTLDAAVNFAKVTLSTGYASGATSVVLSGGDGTRLPAVPFNAVWFNASDYSDPSDDPEVEVVRVTNIVTDTLTITRAQEGTSAVNHNTAGKTYQMVAGPTAKLITDINATFAELSEVVLLQATTPGTPQTGHANITGTATIGDDANVAGDVSATNGILTGFESFAEVSTPSTPAAGVVKIFAQAAASGVTRMNMLASTGKVLAFFRDMVTTVRNETGVQIDKGAVVYITGATGTVSTVALSKADAAATAPVIGFAIANIANNGFGTVQRQGIFTGLNTLSFSQGDTLWVSATTAGAVTNVAPTAPNFGMRVGTVVLSSANGTVDVVIQPFVPALSNKFIVQGTADAGLTGAQFLGALATGIVKVATTTGVLSVAVAGDFPTLNQNTTGNATTASDGLSSASGTAPLTLNLAAKALTGSIAITPTNPGGAVALQATTPGTAQTGNLNLTGNLIGGAIGAGTTPANLIHANSGATPAVSQFRLTANAAGSFSGLCYAADNAQLFLDADWVGSAWVARHTSAYGHSKVNGRLEILGDASLTSGNSFTPSPMMRFDAANHYVYMLAGTGPNKFGLGTETPATLLHAASDTTAAGIATFEQASADADSFDLVLKKTRGTIASPSVITTADELGTIQFAGYSGAGGYVTGAAIKAISAGTIATTRVPASLSFWTGTDAAPTVLTERMTIDKAGNVGVGIAPTIRFHVKGADSASIMGVAGATMGVRLGASATSASVDAVDNTFVSSYQPLLINGSALTFGISGNVKMTISAAAVITIATPPAFAAGDKYLVIDASGNIHKSALGPAS